MTNLLEREVNHSRSESTRLNNLNNRFVNFLDLVKSETKRSDYLQVTLREEKQKYVKDLHDQNQKYVNDLQLVKNSLNNLCLSISEAQLRERNNRIRSEWYSKLIKFEQDSLARAQTTFKVNELSASNSFSSSGYFVPTSQVISDLSSTSSSIPNSNQNDFETNLSEQSTMSSSQTSLSSAYSSSSFIASTTSEEITSPTEPTTTSSSSSTSTSSECLETYLSNVKYMRTQLEFDYERKYTKYMEIKQNVSNLNTNLNELNDKLDQTKIDNITLSENVKNLRKEVEFYRNLKQIKPIELNEPVLDLQWLKTELTNVKRDTTVDYESYNREQLDEYEEELEQDLLEQIDLNELEFMKEQDEFEAESAEILDELIELNKELSESVTEYETLTETNQHLNDRLIQLSTNICSFSDLNQEQQDNLILNYSIKNLEREILSLKQEIKSHKTELTNVKNYLVKKDILNLLDPNQLISFDLNNQTNSLISKTSEPPKYELKIRPYNSQIEYTKSNLFAYLIINFDVTRNYLTVQQNKTSSSSSSSNKNNNINFNSLRIVHDSIDGHNLVIENSHKILDLDLSEWTLRREIQNYVDFNSQLNEQPLNNVNSNTNREVIEFKFPKGFRLKRRKKINLVAAAKLYDSTTSSETNTNRLKSTDSCNSLNETSNKTSSKKKTKNLRKSLLAGSSMSLNGSTTQLSTPTITQTKCACCACKMLMTKKGGSDMDIFEAKEINSWGTGLLVITKFINSKNIIKLVNYKCLKHIWVNNNNNNNIDNISDDIANISN